jgi:hypothetical protein
LVILLAAPLSMSGCAGQAPINPALPSRVPPGHIKTVFLILMENHNWDDIRGSPMAPYINNTLLPAAATANNYKGARGTFFPIHPSEPNYLWLEAGDSFNIANDLPPIFNSQSTRAHLVTQLNDAGYSWLSYQEDIAADSCPLFDINHYSPKHDPMVFFDDVTSNENYCKAHHRPFAQLAADLTSGSVARYNFLTPSLCHDMHDDCGGGAIANGDAWLAAHLPLIMASSAYRDGGAIFITWDESEGTLTCSEPADCNIGMIVLSPFGKGPGFTNTLEYRHSSTLRTMQEIFGLTPLLGDANNAQPLADLFAAYP